MTIDERITELEKKVEWCMEQIEWIIEHRLDEMRYEAERGERIARLQEMINDVRSIGGAK